MKSGGAVWAVWLYGERDEWKWIISGRFDQATQVKERDGEREGDLNREKERMRSK